MVAFRIGGTSRGQVLVEMLDGVGSEGWLGVRVSISVGSFSGAYEASFMRRDFAQFATELRSLYTTLSGIARFSTLEGQLDLKLEGNGRGGIELLGEATDFVGTGNRLRFRLHLDQTHLPAILQDLDAACESYSERAV